MPLNWVCMNFEHPSTATVGLHTSAAQQRFNNLSVMLSHAASPYTGGEAWVCATELGFIIFPVRLSQIPEIPDAVY